MRKKLLFLYLALLPALAVQAQLQEDGSYLSDGLYYKLDSEAMTASVTRNKKGGYTGDIVVPASITTDDGKTYAVTAVEYDAFQGTAITSFTCGENILQMGTLTNSYWWYPFSFQNCSQLKSATINGRIGDVNYNRGSYSATLNGISQAMFQGCSALESVTLGSSIKVIGESAFSYSKSLREVHLSDSLLIIGASAFSGLENLTEVNFPSSLRLIDHYAFQGAGLTKVDIHPRHVSPLPYVDLNNDGTPDGPDPNSLLAITQSNYKDNTGMFTDCIINGYAFANCRSLAEINLSGDVSMSGAAILNTAWREAQPDGVLYIGENAISYKGNVEDYLETLDGSLTIKEGTKRLMRDFCWSVRYINPLIAQEYSQTIFSRVNLPQSLEFIDTYAFYDSQIWDITIPESVKWIGNGAFAKCTVSRIYMQPTVPPSVDGAGICSMRLCEDPISTSSKGYIYKMYVSSASYEAYCEAYQIHDFYQIVPMDGRDSVTGFLYAVNKADKTATITESYGGTIPATIQHEGEDYTVTALAEWSVEVNLEDAEYGKLILPETLRTIAPNAISYYNFYRIGGIPSLEIPASVDSIGFPFTNTTVDFTVSPDNKTFDSRDGCNSIIHTATNTLMAAGYNFHIPASVTAIGNDVFRNHEKIRNIDLPAGLKSIGKRAFAACHSLQGIDIPEGLTEIGDGAFAACDSITSLHIPASVQKIGLGAFSGCLWLTNITVEPANKVYDSRENCNAIVETATNTLIQGCTIQPYIDAEGTTLYNTTLVIPNGIARIGDYAFGMYDYTINYRSYTKDRGKTFQTIVLPPTCTSLGIGAFGEFLPQLNTLIVRTKEKLRFIDSYGMECSPSEVVKSGSVRYYLPVGTLSLYDNSNSYERDFLNRCKEGYLVNGCELNDVDMSATLTTAVLDEEGCLKVPASASGYYEGETYTMTGVGFTTNTAIRDVQKVELPETITRINSGTFFGCQALTSINLPEGLKYIGKRTFYNCQALENLTLPESVEYVGQWAFTNVPITLEEEDGISYFGRIVYADKAQTIKDTLTFREGTTVIAENQFDPKRAQIRDTKFQITFPKSLKTICGNAFGQSLTMTLNANITSYAEVPPVVCQESNGYEESYYQGNKFEIDTLYIPSGSKEAYLTQGGDFTEEMGHVMGFWNPRTVIEMGGYEANGIHYALNAEDGTAVLTSVDIAYNAALDIPETIMVEEKSYTVTGIGGYALSSCSIPSINIPQTVTRIGEGAFQNCRVESVEIPQNVGDFGAYTFENSAVKEVSLPEGMTCIPKGMFNNSTQVASIILPSTLKTIEDYAFKYAHLRYLILPDSVTYIGDQAFAWLGLLNSEEDELGVAKPRGNTMEVNSEDTLLMARTFVTLPESVTHIGKRAFKNIQALESFIREPEGVLTQATFDGYSTIIRLPYGLTEAYQRCNLQNELIERAPQNYTLTYMIDGEVYREVSLPEGTLLTGLLVPEDREGYLFSGWTLEGGQEIPEGMVMPYGGFTLYGSYLVDGIQEFAATQKGTATIYSLDGRQLNGLPSKKGLYLSRGRKILVK